MLSPEIPEEHRSILDSLRLELKIECDGYPDLRGVAAEELCRRFCASSKPYARKICKSAAAVYCHELYFRHILPEGEHSLPEGDAVRILGENFGSADNFFYLVRTLAAGTVAPGFLWLYEKPSRRHPKIGLARLPLYTLPDLRRFRPLFCIDLWEHAYIGAYGCDIAAYADAILRRLDWNSVFADFGP